MNKDEQRRKAEIAIRADLYGEQATKFLEIKEYLMLENNTDVVRTLIREKWQEIQKDKQAADF